MCVSLHVLEYQNAVRFPGGVFAFVVLRRANALGATSLESFRFSLNRGKPLALCFVALRVGKNASQSSTFNPRLTWGSVASGFADDRTVL
jgi:hypothetical protein